MKFFVKINIEGGGRESILVKINVLVKIQTQKFEEEF